MRYVSTKVSKYGTKRIMLVENPQDPKYQGGVLCFMYRGTVDGPSEAAQFYDGFTVDQVIADLAEISDRDPASWTVIPDQLAGCRDDWVGAIRAVRDHHGRLIHGEWERLQDGQWVRFTT